MGIPPGRRAAVIAGAAVITTAGGYAALRSRKSRREAEVEATASTTVSVTPDEAYAFWRRFDRFPEFMTHLEEVRITGDTTSHWKATAPFGRTVEWDAEIVDDLPGKRLSWRSTSSDLVSNDGSVEFRRAPGDQGAEVRVTIRYRGLGPVARAVSRYFGEEPHQQLDDDLRRLKQVLETGEIMRSDGALAGKRARHEFPQRPAQPPTKDDLAGYGVTQPGPFVAHTDPGRA